MSQTISSSQPAQKKVAPKLKIFGTLLTDVIRKNLCVGCGACVASCPAYVIAMKKVDGKDEQPTLIGKCVLCEMCYNQCPMIEPLPKEVDVFGRERSEKESIGVMIGCYSARTGREDVLKHTADGGIVTAILAYGLQEGLIDAAVVCGVSETEPGKAVPKVVTLPEELFKYAGTRYTVSPTLIGLGSAVDNYFCGRVGVVGTPCQIRAVRKMQTAEKGAFKYGLRVGLTIGLFCMESFYHDGLIKAYLQPKVDLSKISRFSIKKGKFIVESDGQKVVDVPLNEVKPYVRENCRYCKDFTAELADISVGGVGSPEGWSTVIVRTETGRKIFEGAAKAGLFEYKPLTEVKPGLPSVEKLSKNKIEQVQKQ